MDILALRGTDGGVSDVNERILVFDEVSCISDVGAQLTRTLSFILRLTTCTEPFSIPYSLRSFSTFHSFLAFD